MNRTLRKMWFLVSRGAVKKVFTLLVLGTCLVSAAEGYQQEVATIQKEQVSLVNLDTEEISVYEMIKIVERQTGYRFSFDWNQIDTETSFSAGSGEQKVESLLSKMVAQTDLVYQIINSNIHLRRSPMGELEHRQPVQQETVRGQVTDAESGETLPGVNVVVKGTTTGTSTDANGIFDLTVESLQDTLIFSFVGYQTQEIPIDRQTDINVALQLQAIAGEELVVVGYGTQQAREVTASITTINSEDITDRQQVQVTQALQGTVPGLTVTRNGNAPGSTADLKIRGVTTLGNSDPLIIVDGVPANSLDNLNANDIEEITVLKDAASASIYGARAAAGVILVKTKRAKVNEFNLDYNFNYGFQRPTARPDYVDVVRYLEITNELRWNDNGNAGTEYPTYPKEIVDNYYQLNQEDPDQYPITDWNELVFNETAPRQSHFLSVSGGSERISSKGSIGLDRSDALYPGRTYRKITARINNNFNINNYLSAELDINYKHSDSDQLSSPIENILFFQTLISAPIYPAVWQNGATAPGKTGTNIYGRVKNGGFNEIDRNTAGGTISLDFHPLENLEISGIFSANLNFVSSKDFQKQIPYYSASNESLIQGYLQNSNTTDLYESRYDDQNYTTQLLATYDRNYGEHSFKILGGYENFYARFETLGASSTRFPLSSFPYLNNGNNDYQFVNGNAYENAYRSFFSRINYSFQEKYLFEASIRRDGSSRFAENYRWGNFPSVSAGWIISNEPFLQESSPLSFLKLRASYGSLGNERIGNYPYQASIDFRNVLLYQGGDITSATAGNQNTYNIEDISWETTTTAGIGLDANFLDDQLQLTADYYQKKTEDMLLALEIPDFLGFENPDQNTGTMETKGWEFQAIWRDKFGDFDYSVSFNLSNSITEMGELGGTEFLGDLIVTEGSEYNEWYGYKTDGLFQTDDEVANSPTINSNVRPGDIKYVDISGPNGKPDGQITPEYDRTQLGGSLPKMQYGGNIKVGYKELSLRITFQGIGKQNSRTYPLMVQPLTNGWGNIPEIIDGNYWSTYNTSQQNINADYPRLTQVNAGSNYLMSDYWLFDGSYFRLKNVTLGYALPNSLVQKLKLKGLNLSVTASDLYTISSYPEGWDPEISVTGYPITTQLLFGVSIQL
ncbi:TonB-linked outer membrane protein, SusC/RagA family [Fodinibius roseus]|uniref:TonB-linked outer membrane protein, SusC/RagA family n=1 Tax=Fodinibius roseus TaxID=1194090 RepID=A0A1M5FWT1_9BACT|nr:TonB-dependent receptor [Fodinibius roseus]SHF95926.1 TonB-linked outer membrane protein, SusC/RagA family [Fodinibius roseus]